MGREPQGWVRSPVGEGKNGVFWGKIERRAQTKNKIDRSSRVERTAFNGLRSLLKNGPSKEDKITNKNIMHNTRQNKLGLVTYTR